MARKCRVKGMRGSFFEGFMLGRRVKQDRVVILAVMLKANMGSLMSLKSRECAFTGENERETRGEEERENAIKIEWRENPPNK